MRTLYEVTQGYKTYLGLLLAILITGSQAVGLLDPSAADILIRFAEILTGYGIYDRIRRGR